MILGSIILLSLKFWATLFLWVFCFKLFLFFPETGHRPRWPNRLLRRPHVPPSKIQKLDQWECDIWSLQILKFLLFLCVKKHTLWWAYIRSKGPHWATSLMRKKSRPACVPTMDLSPLFPTGLHFSYFFYLFKKIVYFISLKLFGIWKNVQHESCLE